MHISANNFQNGIKRGSASYYFSRIPHVWGWASWRRAWQFYDVQIKDFLIFKKQNQIKNIFVNKNIQLKWLGMLEKVHHHQVDTWDFQWTYTIFKQNGLCITPNVNLVTNIGFSGESTHTRNANSLFSNMKRGKIMSIKQPRFILPDREADTFIMKQNFGVSNSLLNKEMIIKYLSKFYKMIKK
jgi:hypothetical protein